MPKSTQTKSLKQAGDNKTETTTKSGPQNTHKEQNFKISIVKDKFDLRSVIEIPKPKKPRTAHNYFMKEHLGYNQREDEQKQAELFKKVV